MPIQKTEAIILRKWDVRETSMIISFFTRDFGKISGLLKGVRSEPEKFASPLEPFSFNEIIFYESRNSNLHLVSQCDLKENFTLLRQNMLKIGSATLMMDLLNALMPQEDPNHQAFTLALDCLHELKTTFSTEKILTIFKIKILELSGFKPHFDSCVACGQKISGHSKFSLARGGLLCPGCLHKDTTSRNIFRGTIATISHIERNDFKNNLNLGINPQIKRELDAILNAFFNFHLEKELKSQKVLDKLEAVA